MGHGFELSHAFRRPDALLMRLFTIRMECLETIQQFCPCQEQVFLVSLSFYRHSLIYNIKVFTVLHNRNKVTNGDEDEDIQYEMNDNKRHMSLKRDNYEEDLK